MEEEAYALHWFCYTLCDIYVYIFNSWEAKHLKWNSFKKFFLFHRDCNYKTMRYKKRRYKRNANKQIYNWMQLKKKNKQILKNAKLSRENA